MVQIEIDGKPVEVKEGSMVMDAANKLGVYIPHFCYHKKLTIAANCRMCLVEVEKAPKPMPACATPVTAGMIVRTHSPKAIQAQQGVMEFLLINHPLDCPICDQGGECQLQDLAVGYGGSNSRYKEEKRVVFEKNVGPLISMKEMTRCIHCTRCVRFGQEIAGVMEFGMLNRGEHSEITTFVGKTVDSELSGNMIDICPVGALLSKPFRYTARTWELSRRRAVSPHDGVGTNLIVQVKNAQVMRVLPLENDAVNECWISDKDRFSYEALNIDDRLTAPMIKGDGGWREVDWAEALDYVASNLRRVVDNDGPLMLGALASPHATLEELHLLQKLVRGLGSDNVDARLRQSDFSGDEVVAPVLGMSITQFAELDRVLVVGSFLRKDQPLLSQRLRQSTKRGALLSIVHASDDDLLMPVANRIIAAPSKWIDALESITSAVSAGEGTADAEAPASIAKSFASGSKKAILLGSAVVRHPQFAALYAAAKALATATGATLGFLTEAANTVGAHLANVYPLSNGLDAATMLAEPRRAYVLLGVEPMLDVANPVAAGAALKSANLVVALTAFKSAVADHATVMLPISPFTETSGTFVNCEGRAQSFNGAVKPLRQTRPGWKVLRVLGNLLNLEGFEQESSESVRDEVTGGVADLSSRCIPRALSSTARAVTRAAPTVEAGDGFERVADVPIYFADPLARRSPPLLATRDGAAPRARVNGRMLAALGVASGDTVEAAMAGGSATLAVQHDDRLADGCIAIAAAHASTSGLPALWGRVTVTKKASAATVPATTATVAA